ncbi:hypothetical protein EDM80_14630 [bacterium]|nr:MAG: hypothetical protein EDM80_14630 [bacterium]RIK63848.1 MAG: hypothetical protein DCC64_05425 [Planctomycetota bacterium]
MKKIALLAAFCAGLMGSSGGVFADDVKKEEATYKKIEAKLDSTTLSVVNYDETDVNEVIKDFAKKGQITIVLDKKALEGVAEADRKITLELADIKLGNALNIVLDQIGLVKSYKNGVLYITTQEKAQGAISTKTYDVRDITMKVQDFPAPEIRLKAQDEQRGPVVDIPKEDPPTTEDIVEMIESTVKADWGSTAKITIAQGQLIVSAPRDVQKSVADLLDQLRASK